MTHRCRRNRRGVIATGRDSQNGTAVLSLLFGGAVLAYGNRSQGLQFEKGGSQKRRFLITLDLRRQSTSLRNKLAAAVRQRLKRGEGSTRPSTDKDDAQLPEGGALESKFALCYRVCRQSCTPRAKRSEEH